MKSLAYSCILMSSILFTEIVNAAQQSCPPIRATKDNLDLEFADLYWEASGGHRIFVRGAISLFMNQEAYLRKRGSSQLLIEISLGKYLNSHTVPIDCRDGSYYFDRVIEDSPVLHDEDGQYHYEHRLTEYEFGRSISLGRFTWDLIYEEIGKIEARRPNKTQGAAGKKLGNGWTTIPIRVMSNSGKLVTTRQLIDLSNNGYAPDSSICLFNCQKSLPKNAATLVGLMGKRALKMNLTINGERITGTYTLNDEGTTIWLDGRSHGNTWELEEFESQEGGSVRGRIIAQRDGDRLYGMRRSAGESDTPEYFFAGPDRLL